MIAIVDGVRSKVSGEIGLCLSPTGCFSLKHEVENSRNDGDNTWERECQNIDLKIAIK